MLEFLIKIIVSVATVSVFVYFFYATLIIFLPAKKSEYITNDIKELEYYFLIPCLNEEKVIENSLKAIMNLKYRNFKVFVIDDASTDNTVKVVTEMKLDKVEIISRCKPNAQKGKGEALNHAYRIIRERVIETGKNPNDVILAVVDGDGRPSKELLNEANLAFNDPAVGAAQARIKIINSKELMPLLQDIEFYASVAAIQNSREYSQSVCLGGNGQFTRLSALMSIGDSPWTQCLLEDFDLGLSVLLKEWKTRYIGESAVYQQGLKSIKRFVKQRSRWVQGNIQSFKRIKEINNAKHLSLVGKIDLYYFLAQPWLSLITSINCLLCWLITIILLFHLDFQSFFNVETNILPMVILIFLVILPGSVWTINYCIACKKSHESYSIKNCFLAIIFYPLYNLLSLPSVWLAFYHQVRRKYGWIKTDRLEE
ncbi:glycosyltransferase family 2 protein [Listeria ilorinensis]|uniref:glycosyltransferase family 2 protein n=1 Tax=Listeria ilorinensis TaxID=2867439 RepID=UPI001EF50F25|nr:glycosyltransferase [Listeria ilorinensis]